MDKTSLDFDPFKLSQKYREDAHPRKVNLGIGVYRSDEGLPWPLPVVRKVEEQIFLENDISRHEYTSITGDQAFLQGARELVFGFNGTTTSETKVRVASVQSVSGTGANHLGAMYAARVLNSQTVWISDPTWDNHHTIWEHAGVSRQMYPYVDNETMTLNLDGMLATLRAKASPGDVILLHACAHNPTGIDPTRSQWMEIASVCLDLDLFVIFDFAYQGFASGDLDEDAWAIRHFFYEHPTINMCVAQSFSKNFGLYGQRVGACHIVVRNSSFLVQSQTISQLAYWIRAEYSMAPSAGAVIVARILQNPELSLLWKNDISQMSERIKSMRRDLHSGLVRSGTLKSWQHVMGQVSHVPDFSHTIHAGSLTIAFATKTGMFSYTGLSLEQVVMLREKYHIYMLGSGRISLSGCGSKISIAQSCSLLTMFSVQPSNIEYVADSIERVSR